MMKYLFLLLGAVSFAADVHAEGVRLNPSLLQAAPEGGMSACQLVYERQDQSGRWRIPEYVRMERYVSDAQVDSVVNNGGSMMIYFKPNCSAARAEGSVSISVSYGSSPAAASFQTLSLSYVQSGYSYFHGGEIAAGERVWRRGEFPDKITSVNLAFGSRYGRIVYSWEKRNARDTCWTLLSGQTDGAYCQPDRMEDEFVSYRRVARDSTDIAYSNTVVINAPLNPGIIALSRSDERVFVLYTTDPNVPWKQTRVEYSDNLVDWRKIGTHGISSGKGDFQSLSIVSFAVPDRTAYCRGVAEDLDGNCAYSNVACYNRDENPHISTKIAVDSTGVVSNEDIVYYDGLGRPAQTVAVGGSPSGADIAVPFSYDEKGRRQNDYLPYLSDAPGNSIATTSDLLARQSNYYSALFNSGREKPYPYIHREYDDSPLNRIIRTFRQGPTYQTHKNHYSENLYTLNGIGEVRLLRVNSGDSLQCSGYCRPNSLYKTRLVDEDGAVLEDFTDAKGRKLLSRQYISRSETADTYYVYDDLDRLRWVVPPEGSARLTDSVEWGITGENAGKYCYRYCYDGNGNVSVRYIPGRDADRMTYDNAGKIRSDQNGAMTARNLIRAYHYDPLGRLERVALQLIEDPVSPTDPVIPGDPGIEIGPGIEIDPDNPGIGIDPGLPEIDPGGPLDPKPGDPIIIRPLRSVAAAGIRSHDTERYRYDGYDSAAYADHSFTSVSGVIDSRQLCRQVRGLKTHEEIFEVFDDSAFSSGTASSLKSTRRTFYYDVRNRVIQRFETTPQGHLLRTSYKYDYPGNVLVREELHSLADASWVRVRYLYDYDLRGRQTRERVIVDDVQKTDISFTYDDLGRLCSTFSAGNNLETSYNYNLQGWLTSIGYNYLEYGEDIFHGGMISEVTPVFSCSLTYYDPVLADSLYTGNISEIAWSRELDLAAGRRYAFRYDALGRLTDAELYKGIMGGFTPQERYAKVNSFTERNMAYDRNGNMLEFERWNGGERVKYVYVLDGNRIATEKLYAESANGTSVQPRFEDDALSYDLQYDAMGNLILDRTSGLSIAYDLTNLPREITVAPGSSSSPGTTLVRYSYLWDGTKQVSADSHGNGYLYMGSMRYALTNNEAHPESLSFSGGRILYEGDSLAVRYFLTDHLGSVRAIVDDRKELLAEYDYMPYGTQHNNPALAVTGTSDHRYNSKEFQERFGVDLYDYGARMYNSFNGRWPSIDPLAEKYCPVSRETHCTGNTIRYVDPDRSH